MKYDFWIILAADYCYIFIVWQTIRRVFFWLNFVFLVLKCFIILIFIFKYKKILWIKQTYISFVLNIRYFKLISIGYINKIIHAFSWIHLKLTIFDSIKNILSFIYKIFLVYKSYFRNFIQISRASKNALNLNIWRFLNKYWSYIALNIDFSSVKKGILTLKYAHQSSITVAV